MSTDWQKILNDICDEVSSSLSAGNVATYIPELANVRPDQFGIAMQTVDGARYAAGDADVAFSTQSVSKVFTLTLAMRVVGDRLWDRVGREPSGNPFNSLVQLEYENGIPRNPFINAGALVVTDVLLTQLADAKRDVRNFVRRRADSSAIDYDNDVAASEQRSGFRNAALANFLKGFGNLDNPVDAVLDAYYHHCALAMSCTQLCKAGLYLANRGRDADGHEVTTPAQTQYINSLMLTCGAYDAVGDFAYRVGLPGKSGVGGGILAVLPGRFTVCAWSPGLNRAGNSLAGTQALELFTTRAGCSIF